MAGKTKTIYCARLITHYEDGIPLGEEEYTFDSEQERLDFLKDDYEEDEIDIDVENREWGWQFYERTINI